MSDYPMLISNKLHSFRNFAITKIQLFIEKLLFLPHYFGVGNFSK